MKTTRDFDSLPIVAFDADKALTVLDHVLDEYFPTDKPDTDTLPYYYPQIRNLISVARDYASKISTDTHTVADKL